MNSITLGDTLITDDPNSSPYIIAEVGVNHEGSLTKAKELIELTREGGADAVKFQTYKADTLASKHSPAYWDTSKEPTKSQYELFKKHDSFGCDEFIQLAEHAARVGIDFVSTPFDDAAVDFLEPLMPFYKIASADLTNTPFLRKIARKKKPVVLSVGASTLDETRTAVRELKLHGSTEIALLHCVLNYPTPDEKANLNMIHALAKEFPDHVIGYSDHTLPDPSMIVTTTAFLKGAKIIEKHFTFDKTLPGNDHYHAMDLEDLRVLRRNLRKIILIGGSAEKAPLESEAASRLNARRSIVLRRAIPKGTVIEEDVITYKRPAHGISPACWDQVLCMRAVRDLEEDHVLQWVDLQE